MKRKKIKFIDILNVLDEGSINLLLDFCGYDVWELEKETRFYKISLIQENLFFGKYADIDELIDIMAISLTPYKYDLFLERLEEFLEND